MEHYLKIKDTYSMEHYLKITVTYSMEHYLKIKDYQNRKAISKLRTSSHLLKIETGRRTNIAGKIEYAHNVDRRQ